MITHSDIAFKNMDRLSLDGKAFFFMIDFLGENAIVIEQKDYHTVDFAFQFPDESYNADDNNNQTKNFYLHAYPETEEQYAKGFYHIQKNMLLGNSYLANYTQATHIETPLNIAEIFSQTTAKYKVRLKNNFVCFSPETFIEIKNNIITTHPMKGTIDANIPNAKQILKTDKKEKAEHYTVVDLLRNDLSQIAQKVQVKKFQKIDTINTHYGKLLAMSSEIEGQIKPKYQNKIGSILKKIIPAGSILGAPKQKTLEIILQAEKTPRNWYTGIAGIYNGKNLNSCVMIRFIENINGKLYFRSGGGITHNSNIKNEYQEMIKKIYLPIKK